MNWLALVALSAAGASGSVDSESGLAAPAAVVAPAAAEEQAPAELDGLVTERAGGGYLQLKVEGVHLVLRAFNEEKKPVAFEVDRGSARLQFASRTPEQVVFVLSDDKMTLRTNRPVRPPHVFRANLFLFAGQGEDAVESYQLSFP